MPIGGRILSINGEASAGDKQALKLQLANAARPLQLRVAPPALPAPVALPASLNTSVARGAAPMKVSGEPLPSDRPVGSPRKSLPEACVRPPASADVEMGATSDAESGSSSGRAVLFDDDHTSGAGRRGRLAEVRRATSDAAAGDAIADAKVTAMAELHQSKQVLAGLKVEDRNIHREQRLHERDAAREARQEAEKAAGLRREAEARAEREREVAAQREREIEQLREEKREAERAAAELLRTREAEAAALRQREAEAERARLEAERQKEQVVVEAQLAAEAHRKELQRRTGVLHARHQEHVAQLTARHSSEVTELRREHIRQSVGAARAGEAAETRQFV